MNQLAQLDLPGKGSLSYLRSRAVWWDLVALSLLMGWLYYSILTHLVAQWIEDPNFSHGFLVPAFSIFVVWRDRFHLLSLPLRPSSTGLLMVAFSLAVLVAGVLGAELFLARVSLVFLLAGLIVVLFGTNHLRAVLFPLAFLILMIPIPAIVLNEITFPLQIVVSKLAASLLPWLGVPVLREGNILNLPSMSLEVAEACSGIRSLLSLITLAIIYGYATTSIKWVRVALLVAAVPIAIVANGLRIVITGLLVQYWNPDKAEGFFHAFSGWLVFLVSLMLLGLLQQALSWACRERGRRDASKS